MAEQHFKKKVAGTKVISDFFTELEAEDFPTEVLETSYPEAVARWKLIGTGRGARHLGQHLGHVLASIPHGDEFCLRGHGAPQCPKHQNRVEEGWKWTLPQGAGRRTTAHRRSQSMGLA